MDSLQLLVDDNIKFVTNQGELDVFDTLKRLFKDCKSFYLSVAFINYSGLQLLLDILKEMEDKGVKGKVLTSDYLSFTDPTSIKKLHSFKNIQTKVFKTGNENYGFHSKGYIFEYDDCYRVLIGSSNITQSALKSNVEWNLEVVSKNNTDFIQGLINEFNRLMSLSDEVNDEFIEVYENFYNNIKNYQKDSKTIFAETKEEIKPNYFQKNALKKLDDFRKKGHDKAIIVASTGTGKTYASVFDVNSVNPGKLLYIVHNENILQSAKKSFERLIKDKKCGLYTGNVKDREADYLFTTIQTISRDEHLNSFDTYEFDYIIYDECHRSFTETYQKVMNYFRPKFMLGMTATPERTDGGNIYKLYDYNLASDVRLEDALNHQLLVPFHYFGINDNIDLSDVKLENKKKVEEKLSVPERVDFIVEKMEYYGFDGTKRKCLGFCINKKHAKFMKEQFELKGYNAVVLTGEDSTNYREDCIKRLQSDVDPLEFIFTVDIFNEGIDIPQVNLILMLRPTESPIIFTQQLGRGLRKYNSKEFLTVLDFISNYNRSYMMAVALTGKRIDKETITHRISTNFKNLGGGTNISLDPVSQKRIIEQLKNARFNNLLYLSKSYKDYAASIGKEVLELRDFLISDYAPDPIKFIKYSSNYLLFLNSALKDNKVDLTQEEITFINYFSNMLPINRINEYLAISLLLERNTISKQDLKEAILRLVDRVTDDSVSHTFEYLSGAYNDSLETEKYADYFIMSNDNLSFGEKTKEILKNEIILNHLKDLVNYGLIRYIEEYGNDDYGFPFLKLYQSYTMRDMGLLSNYRKIHSSIRGQGVWHDSQGNYYLFAEINKSSDIRASINYNNYFKSTRIFQWQSPNATTQNSKEGKVFTLGKHNLYLFVRKKKKEEGKTLPYVYIGKVIPIRFDGEKPITIDFKLENELPRPIFEEMKKENKYEDDTCSSSDYN